MDKLAKEKPPFKEGFSQDGFIGLSQVCLVYEHFAHIALIMSKIFGPHKV